MPSDLYVRGRVGATEHAYARPLTQHLRPKAPWLPEQIPPPAPEAVVLYVDAEYVVLAFARTPAETETLNTFVTRGYAGNDWTPVVGKIDFLSSHIHYGPTDFVAEPAAWVHPSAGSLEPVRSTITVGSHRDSADEVVNVVISYEAVDSNVSDAIAHVVDVLPTSRDIRPQFEDDDV
jgi:hypothetical protein